MFARIVTMNLKPGNVANLTENFEKQVIPMLRKQKGFQDVFTCVSPTGSEAIGFSLWDNKENADAYSTGGYLEVLKNLEQMIEGTPRVKTYEIANSTSHKAVLATL